MNTALDIFDSDDRRADDVELIIQFSNFSSNQAKKYGGAVDVVCPTPQNRDVSGKSQVMILDSVFMYNVGGTYGGGLAVYECLVTLENRYKLEPAHVT